MEAMSTVLLDAISSDRPLVSVLDINPLHICLFIRIFLARFDTIDSQARQANEPDNNFPNDDQAKLLRRLSWEILRQWKKSANHCGTLARNRHGFQHVALGDRPRNDRVPTFPVTQSIHPAGVSPCKD
jgi:hypothetical protein